MVARYTWSKQPNSRAVYYYFENKRARKQRFGRWYNECENFAFSRTEALAPSQNRLSPVAVPEVRSRSCLVDISRLSYVPR